MHLDYKGKIVLKKLLFSRDRYSGSCLAHRSFCARFRKIGPFNAFFSRDSQPVYAPAATWFTSLHSSV